MKNQSTEHREQKTKNSQGSENGSALLITLLIVTLLISLTVEFAYEVFVGVSATSNWSNAQKASLTARSGQILTYSYLQEVQADKTYTDTFELELPVKTDFGPDTALLVKIEDENARLNVNSIIMQNGRTTNETSLATLKKLFEYLKINPSLALVIADWIDVDDEPRVRDSEYKAKNSPLWSVEELLLINGVDKKIFETISPYLTVYGSGLVNINTAKLPVLVSLHPDITETLAKRIIDYRKSSPFEDSSHIGRVSGMGTIGQNLQGRITAKSSYFRIFSTATVNDITRVIESVTDTSTMVHFWREG